MNVIESYNSLPISKLQSIRLYMQGRPLSLLLRKKNKNIPYLIPDYVWKIDKELTSNYIALDCSGWYFENDNRKCTAIEIDKESLRFRSNIIFEYDYNIWRPTYLETIPILAYFSTYFKYSTLNEFLNFCNVWGKQHHKLIIGLDPTKIKFNYLKYNLLDELQNKLSFPNSINVLQDIPFNLLFTVTNENLSVV